MPRRLLTSLLAACFMSLTVASARAAPTVLFLGDSLTAGYQLAPEQAYPALVEAALRAQGREVRVINAGISGDTSTGGLRRLAWALKAKPDLVVVALGANDGLRGVDPEVTRDNLRRIVEGVRAAGATAALVGIRVPLNYGPDFRRRFEAVFPELGEELGVPLLPFLLEGVATVPELNLGDGLHPNARGHQVMARTVLEFVRPLLEDAAP